MSQYALDLRQLRLALAHPACQAVTQHVRCDRFQPSCQVLKRCRAFDITLPTSFLLQLMCSVFAQSLNRSLCDPLRDPWDGRLAFHHDIDPDQQTFTFLITADGRHAGWTANEIKIAT